MPGSFMPHQVDSAEAVTAIEQAALKVETPCGSGTLKWHLWGETDGEPVVLLHGGSGSWNHWVRNIAALVDHGFRVLAPDLPGFGASDLPAVGFDADAHVEPILNGIERLLGAKRCHIVAFSFGCMVASFIALQRPERVRRLVLVGAPALTTEPGPSLGLHAWRDLPVGPMRSQAHANNLCTVMLNCRSEPPSFLVELHGNNVERDRIPQRRLFKTDVIAKTLPSVEALVWAIWGAEDALHRGRLESYVGALSNARQFQTMTLIPRAGHWVQFEAASIFNSVLLSILDASHVDGP